ncbi:hypothetical protein F511_39769 [Dorcoceras hygrometricum]|uniref:Zinc finger BED domain-containing protein RICESLEEPER 2-like n=1 Tax=Dorcoceras hygrometricum TaxID=472368 RepID=A0A2Z7BDE6_9LAMI|nr:hypothetical protein F511_39769 [Dorcoceras hygrometricum]
MFHEYKEALISQLSSISCRVSLTTDIWTNIKSQSYLVVTCHWIDETWKMQKRILSLDVLDSSHSGYTIALYVLNVAKVFGIQNKIMSITLDNASANNSALKYLKDSLKPILDGELLHVRCACHVINLCVKCAFDFVWVPICHIVSHQFLAKPLWIYSGQYHCNIIHISILDN